ncbi:hypothetical protein AMJ57_04885 [Parcubacteria bacterium SG8_24]|nr:MAG: hypothetical protein AMJ57_04885 [Parcubacteria bacterium SG8_24]
MLKTGRFRSGFKSLRVIAGPTRFKIMVLLSHHKDGLIVSELAEIMKMSLSRVSHQLKIMRQHGLVTHRRMGNKVLYSLEVPRHLHDLLNV